MKNAVDRIDAALLRRVMFWTACWAVLVFSLGYVVQRFLPFTPTYPYYDTLLGPLAPGWLARWGGFDGVHYITIVRKGYIGTGLIQAFFPVYPYLIRALNLLRNPLLTGLAVSLVCAFGSVALLVKLAVRVRVKPLTSRYLVGLVLSLLTFPTALFFLGLYTESLFLLLVLGAWYTAYKKQWLVASILAGIASGTRIVGIALFPALLLQAYLDHKKEKRAGLPWKTWFTLCLSMTGLVLFMLFLYKEFHDPLYFFHVQSEFGAGRQESLILFPQVIYRYIKILLTYRPIDWSYYAYLQEFILTLEVGIALAIMTRMKSLRNLPFLVFSWITYLLPSFTGTFSSMPRYVLVIFPMYLLYARVFERRPRLGALIFAFHAILLVINIVLFIQGKWVA